MSKLLTGLLIFVATTLAGCGLNDFQRLDEQVTADWAGVLAQYQRRADLVPNIVASVKGEANVEQETLTRVIEARARATSLQATPALINDPQAFQKFQAAQGELAGALSRLMVVVESYPNLKAIQGFRDLRIVLAGTAGVLAAIERISHELAAHFPPQARNDNELPDAPVVL